MTPRPGLDADLATLRVPPGHAPACECRRCEKHAAALDRVEAELARLREERDDLAEQVRLRDLNALDGASVARVIDARDAAEARCAELAADLENEAVAYERVQERCARLQQALAQISETAHWYARNDDRLRHEVDHCLCVEIPSIADEALAGPDTPADSPEWQMDGTYADLSDVRPGLRKVTPADSQEER